MNRNFKLQRIYRTSRSSKHFHYRCCTKGQWAIQVNGNRPAAEHHVSTSHIQPRQHAAMSLLHPAPNATTYSNHQISATHTHAHTRLTVLCPGLPWWASTRKVKPIWILLKQETVRGSGISWAICKSAPCSRQITMPAPYHSVFYRPDALPAAKPTASKHWRQDLSNK